MVIRPIQRLFTLSLVLILTAVSTTGYSQVFYELSESDIIAELEKRGLEYEEVKNELFKNGVDITTLESTDVTLEQRQTIERVILELQQKKILESEEERIREEREKEAPPDLEIEGEEAIDSLEMDNMELEEEVKEANIAEVEIYGQEIFRNNVLQVAKKSDEINAPDSYVLGPGDELVIAIWGRSQFEKEYIIGADGYIRLIDGRERVFLKGVTLGSAREKIRKILQN